MFLVPSLQFGNNLSMVETLTCYRNLKEIATKTCIFKNCILFSKYVIKCKYFAYKIPLN